MNDFDRFPAIDSFIAKIMILSSSRRALTIWFCVALFYMYQFVLRVSPSVMMRELMTSFHVGAGEIGSLSAVAMYCYAFFQIPSGLLVDLFGVRNEALETDFHN